MSKTRKRPVRVSIRSYQVGFGDCFLVTFHYPPSASGQTVDKHVLIDFGSTGKPKNGPSLKEIAERIALDCGGKLTAIVASHRHADHINGFATNLRETASGDIIKKLRPELILQPWTEHPDLPVNAKSLPPRLRSGGKRLGAAEVAWNLNRMHDVAAAVLREVEHQGHRLSASVRKQLAFLGEENLANLSAVRNLIAMGAASRAEYLGYGDATYLDKLLPGVKVHVLGPPTPQQYPEVTRQRSRDAGEFWHLAGVSARRLTGGQFNPFPNARRYARKDYPRETRWLVSRIRALHGAQRLALVRALDDAMNNTSLILLMEVGGKKLLFPGDAQLENWSYALHDAKEAEANRTLLSETDFYKVGHHGSLNATPKSLWKLFAKRGGKTKRIRLHSAVSTMAGKHGTLAAKTEVPRGPLVSALKKESNYSTTQNLRSKGTSPNLIKFDIS